MVTKSNARRSNSSPLCSSQTRTPGLAHNCKSSSTNGLRYTSMSLPGCFGPWMSTGIIMNFRFMHNQGGRLYKYRVTGPVLWLLLCSPKGLMPSALRPNHTLLASSANSSRTFFRFFSTATRQRVLSTFRLSYGLLCAIASPWHALCFGTNVSTVVL